MKATRIYLGGDNAKNGARFGIADVASTVSAAGFPGATFHPAFGLWEGKFEETWVIELFGADPDKVDSLASALKIAFHQDAVAVDHEGTVSLV